MTKQTDLGYDAEDANLDEFELKEKYSRTGQHPKYNTKWWREFEDEPMDSGGYWDCVAREIAKDVHPDNAFARQDRPKP